MVEYTKKKTNDSNVIPTREFVWIRKPKPLKVAYTITCYSKWNLDINEFHTQMLDRMNATNIVLPNIPNNLDLRFVFDNKILNKDLRNVNTEKYMLCTFTLNVDGFMYNLNDMWRDTGIENINISFKEGDDFRINNPKDIIDNIVIDWNTGSRQFI
jgi:hypothetical protein